MWGVERRDVRFDERAGLLDGGGARVGARAVGREEHDAAAQARLRREQRDEADVVGAGEEHAVAQLDACHGGGQGFGRLSAAEKGHGGMI